MFIQTDQLKSFSLSLSLSLSLSIILIGSIAFAQNNNVLNAPTINTDKTEVKYGNNITIFGESSPSAEITIQVAISNNNGVFYSKVITNNNGKYSYDFDTSLLNYGYATAMSKASLKGQITELSEPVHFTIGSKNTARIIDGKCFLRGDFNNDCKVNLADFSILAYWYGRSNPPKTMDLDNNGIIDKSDFDFLMRNWSE